MKVGDLIRHIPSGDLGLVVTHNDMITMVAWLDELGEEEDTYIYDGELEIANEA